MDQIGPLAECIKADRLDGMCQWSQLSGCVGLDQGHRGPSSPIFTDAGDDGSYDSLTSTLAVSNNHKKGGEYFRAGGG